MLQPTRYPILSQIDGPTDLKRVAQESLPALCEEIRDYLVHSVAQTGGHLGASLGTVELTVALHYVYDTPADRVIWDVGHQTYVHKILTGRARQMSTMRKKQGLAGFPKRDESDYDPFGVGHSSTSISAAQGMAEAVRHDDDPRKVVAVIGDGAMTAGMAFEALNNAGDRKTDMLVILNDNDMAISPNVGALNKYLARLLTGSLMQGARESGKKILKALPPMHEFARRAEEHMKGMFVPGTLFEELGFNYYGPVDGHDVLNLVAIFRNLKKMVGPQIFHVVTKKGKGYEAAENDALALHAVTPFDPATGQSLSSGGKKKKTYTQVFSDWICATASVDERLIGITPAMREGSGLVEFERQFPKRYFDVGIAEQHAVTFAAGMACEGKKPVVAIYSTFMQRAYDQIVHDVVLQGLPVLFAVDRAGVVGPDGPTHAGSFDVSFLRCLPNVLLMAPADEAECWQMLCTGFWHPGPAVVRYPRGSGPGATLPSSLEALPVGRAQLRRRGSRAALLAFGSVVAVCEQIAEEQDLTFVNMRFIKPLDTQLLMSLAEEHSHFIVVEENAVAGGAGAGIAEWLCQADLAMPPRLSLLGLPDRFLEHGSREELLADAQLDELGLQTKIQQLLDARRNY